MNDKISHRYVNLDFDRFTGKSGPVTVSVRAWGRIGSEPIFLNKHEFENVTPASLNRLHKVLGIDQAVLRPEGVRVSATIRPLFANVEAYVRGRL